MPGCHQIGSRSTLGRHNSFGLVLGTVLLNATTHQLSTQSPSLVELTAVKKLGFTLDQELSMKDHVSKCASRATFSCGQIRTIRHSLSPSAIRTLVHAFICSRIDFSNSLLYGNECVSSRSSSVGPEFLSASDLENWEIRPDLNRNQTDLHWLPIQARIRFKMNVITRNCLVGQAPEYLTELCRSINEVPARRNLRSATQFSSWSPVFARSVPVDVVSPSLPATVEPTSSWHSTFIRGATPFRKRLNTHFMQQSVFHHWGSMSPMRHLLLLLKRLWHFEKIAGSKCQKWTHKQMIAIGDHLYSPSIE